MGTAVTFSPTLFVFIGLRTEGRPPGQRFVEPCRMQPKKGLNIECSSYFCGTYALCSVGCGDTHRIYSTDFPS